MHLYNRRPPKHHRECGVSQDNNQVLTRSRDGTANLWSAQNGKQLQSMLGKRDINPNDVSLLAILPDGGLVFTSTLDHHVGKFWSRETGLCVQTMVCPEQDEQLVLTRFALDGVLLLSISRLTNDVDVEILLTWSVESGIISLSVHCGDAADITFCQHIRYTLLCDTEMEPILQVPSTELPLCSDLSREVSQSASPATLNLFEEAATSVAPDLVPDSEMQEFV